MVVESCSSSMHLPSDEDVAEMERMMSNGKRNYICNQPQLALECFVLLCEKLSNCYGQVSEKCVEAYLYYGKTLLDIARLENGVLGHAIKETPVFGTETEPEEAEEKEKTKETEDDEEITPEKRDDIRNHVEHAMRGENLYNESTPEEVEEEEESIAVEEKKNEENEESKSENGAENGAKDREEDLAENEAKNGAENGAENGHTEDDGENIDGSDDEGDAEVSNMELAWEMFELTVVICNRQLNEEGTDHKSVKTTLAEAKHGLAQISLETERYEDAVSDFNECLKIYQEILEDKNDRLMAEAHYNIALALSFDKKYSEAITKFEDAVSVLKARVALLDSKVKESEEKGDKGKAPPELDQWKKEIVELNDLIVLDMMAKIEDAHESKKILDESIKTVKNAASDLFSSLGGVKHGFDEGFDSPLGGGDGKQGNGFDQTFDSPLGGGDVKQIVNDCSMKIRSIKRKNEDDTAQVSDKKLKQSTTESNGHKETLPAST